MVYSNKTRTQCLRCSATFLALAFSYASCILLWRLCWVRELTLLSCFGLRAAFLIGVIGSFSESFGDCNGVNRVGVRISSEGLGDCRGVKRVGVLISSHTEDFMLDSLYNSDGVGFLEQGTL